MIKGYKVFNPDWTCRGFQYRVGETYEMDKKPRLCDVGFHFCKRVVDCFNFYRFDSNNKVAEVEALGDIDTDVGIKYCTNKIKIVRELTWYEVLDLVNVGKNCTGYGNTDNANSGNRNTGECNSGNYNTGIFNSGDYNTGSCNSNNRNTGDLNSGYYNTGSCNTGYFNSGDFNNGSWNSGSHNIGSHNSGDWNIASYSSGCFNTEDRPLFFFDKPTNMTLRQWHTSKAYHLLNEIDLSPVKWINFGDMTDKEKSNYPEAKIVGGYLKELDNNTCYVEWWKNLSDEEKEVIKEIPNFDPDKFYKITGIKVYR